MSTTLLLQEIMTENSSPSVDYRLPRTKVDEAVVQAILDALRGIKYGVVTVSIQDGEVMQIDRHERFRLKP